MGEPMLDSIEGTCVFTPEQVKSVYMDVVQQSVNDLSAKIQDLQNKATETAELTEGDQRRNISGSSPGREVYDGASLEEKKGGSVLSNQGRHHKPKLWYPD